jgi:uncharacterized protein
VNLYVPGEVTWRQGAAACRLSIQTDYPYASAIAMTVQTPTAQTFSINLRIPAWAHDASVMINGRRSDQPLRAGQFAQLRREWHSGDRIELTLPLPLRIQPVDAQHPDTVALLAGPLVLMRLLEADSSDHARLSRADLLSAKPDLSDRRQWQAGVGAAAISLRAFADISDRVYSAYQDVVAT